eukprot:11852625-Prorocentrum_lima.AAC.1
MAEKAALLMALVCVLSEGARKVTFCCDSTSAIAVINGGGGQNTELDKLIANLVALAKSVCSIEAVHIKGHDLHPWNEAADTLAKSGLD